ncbi:hypothetical protein DMENIID0001_151550 [Sergentomyia squamirostris]
MGIFLEFHEYFTGFTSNSCIIIIIANSNCHEQGAQFMIRKSTSETLFVSEALADESLLLLNVHTLTQTPVFMVYTSRESENPELFIVASKITCWTNYGYFVLAHLLRASGLANWCMLAYPRL